MEDFSNSIPLFVSKQHLASLYLPDLKPRSAVNRLMQWIAYNKQLSAELKRTGYCKTQKQFTREQVRLIFEYLDEP